MAQPTREDATFARRYRRQKNRGRAGGSLVGLRVRDLEALFRDRYGDELPDDDSGRDDVFVMANHLAWYASGDSAERIRAWAATWAPWMLEDELDVMLEHILPRPLRWRADTLARRLGLTAADRERLGITTIGAIDETPAQRRERRRKRVRLGLEAKRRAAGAKPRRLTGAPWIALGIGRSTWFRRQRDSTCAA